MFSSPTSILQPIVLWSCAWSLQGVHGEEGVSEGKTQQLNTAMCFMARFQCVLHVENAMQWPVLPDVYLIFMYTSARSALNS